MYFNKSKKEEEQFWLSWTLGMDPQLATLRHTQIHLIAFERCPAWLSHQSAETEVTLNTAVYKSGEIRKNRRVVVRPAFIPEIVFCNLWPTVQPKVTHM